MLRAALLQECHVSKVATVAGASTVRKAGFVVKIRKADSDRLGAHWKTL